MKVVWVLRTTKRREECHFPRIGSQKRPPKMKCSMLKRFKVFPGLILISIGWFLHAAYEVYILNHFSLRAKTTPLHKGSHQDNSSKQEESIAVYFYKKERDMGNPFEKCKDKCHFKEGFSEDKNAVIVFHSHKLPNGKPLRKYPGQLWVFHSMEPPAYHHQSRKLKMWKNVFNWTLGYRRDTDILNTYGMFYSLRDGKKPVNVSSSWNSRSNKSIIFVSHCGAVSKRLLYIKNMNQSYGVDVYGHCGDFKCPKSNWDECNNKIRSYKFYLAFENSFCKDYITEKMFKVYLNYLHTIPVGRGGSQYELFLPPKSYLDTSKFLSTKELTEHMWRLSENEPEAADYFKWTNSFFGHSYLRTGFCELCKRLHDPILMEKNTRLYRDIDSWFRGSEHNQMCATPTVLV